MRVVRVEREKIKLSVPVVVEGRYDKIKLASILDAVIITTDGFRLFKNKDKLSLLKKAAKNGIIIMTDSDGAGKVIRSHIAGSIPRDKIYDLYVPRIEGKERRKAAPSKEGILGVEGIDIDTLYSIFDAFAKKHGLTDTGAEKIEKGDLYEAGLTGAPDSRMRRDALAKQLGMPEGMSSPALLSALRAVITKEEFFRIIGKNNEK